MCGIRIIGLLWICKHFFEQKTRVFSGLGLGVIASLSAVISLRVDVKVSAGKTSVVTTGMLIINTCFKWSFQILSHFI